MAARDSEAIEREIASARPRLVAAVRLRLPPSLKGRLDPSDVVQEACEEAIRRARGAGIDPRLSAYLWLRFLTMQQLQIAQRRHLGTASRDARRERSLGETCELSSEAVAAEFATTSTPSDAAMKNERAELLRAALERLDPVAREVLALRHFEGLANREAAAILNVSPATASRCYASALLQLKGELATLGLEPSATRSGSPS